MAMKRSWLMGFLLGGAVVTATAVFCDTATSAAQPQPRSQAAKRAPVIGHLQLRKYRVTFSVGDRFTVHTRDGKQVAADVTLAELKSIDLGLYEALEPIVAGDAFVYAGK